MTAGAGRGRLETLERPGWLPETEWPFRVQAVSADGCRLHLVDEGAGPVLLLVHAGMWSFVWRDLTAELSREFRCVAVDFPGSGLTQAPDDYPIGIGPNALLLEGVVDRLGLTDLTLVAHDLGGLTGLAMAAPRRSPWRSATWSATGPGSGESTTAPTATPRPAGCWGWRSSTA